MATPALNSSGSALPGEAELQAFAHAAAQLLIERRARAGGAPAATRRPGSGLQHLDHRDYLPGDEVRHIDWRQTARARRPVVRRFESESVSDWTILLDASSSMMLHGLARWHAARRVAAAMGYALLHAGHRVGLVVFGARVLAECPRGRGRHHYAALARTLAALQPAPRGERSAIGVCARHLRGAATVFAIGDFLAADEMRGDLAALRAHCSELHVLELRAEGDSRIAVVDGELGLVDAVDGEFDLVDVETGARLAVRSGAGVHAEALRERAAMTARLRHFCLRSGAAFTDWDIADGWQGTLIRHLVRARSRC